MQKINVIIKKVKIGAKYYIDNKEVVREDAKNRCRNLSKKKRKHQRDRYFCNIDLNESLDNIKEIIMLLKK